MDHIYAMFMVLTWEGIYDGNCSFSMDHPSNDSDC